MTKFYTETLMVPPDQVEPNPWNPNEMEDMVTATLTRVLEHYGLFGGIPVRQLTDRRGQPIARYQIIDGEQRYQRLVAAGDALIPVTPIPNLTEDDARTLTLTLNNLRGEHDIVKLAAVFAAIQDPSLLTRYAGYTPEYLSHFVFSPEVDLDSLLAAAEANAEIAALNVVRLTFTFNQRLGQRLRRALTLTAAAQGLDSDEAVLVYWATQAGALPAPKAKNGKGKPKG